MEAIFFVGSSRRHFYRLEGTIRTISLLVFKQFMKDWQNLNGVHVGDILVRYTIVCVTDWRCTRASCCCTGSLDHMSMRRLLRLVVVMVMMSMFFES